ncbi:MAG TPA: tetratricopeptide repeat protein, partial [Chryseosolibacter sp.]|nr:tetratricopeptide repeat protein [Chryseosolibacter sp.]
MSPLPDMMINSVRVAKYVLIVITTVAWGPVFGQIDSLLAAYREVSDSTAKAALQLRIAWHYQAEEAYGKAIAYYREYLDHASATDSASADHVPLLNNIAFCYRELGDVDHEIDVHKEILQRLGHRPGTGRWRHKTLQQLSTLYMQRRDYREAIRLNEEMLAYARRANDPLAVVQAYNNLGYIYHLLREPGLSAEHFNKGHKVITEQDIKVNEDDRASMLINFAVVNVNMGSLKEAAAFLQEAYQIRLRQNDPVKIAQTLSYLATYDYLQNKADEALQQVNRAIAMLSSSPASDERDLALTESYKLVCQIMLKRNDLAAFRRYSELFAAQQDQVIQKERRKNKLLVERQLEAERTRNEIQRLMAEQEKNRLLLSQASLEREKREKELELQRSRLGLLEEQNALRQQQYLNKELENRQIQQMLDLVRQRSMADSQQQRIDLLEKEKQVQVLQL